MRVSLEVQLPIYWVPVLKSLFDFILSGTQGPIWVPGLLGLYRVYDLWFPASGLFVSVWGGFQKVDVRHGHDGFGGGLPLSFFPISLVSDC